MKEAVARLREALHPTRIVLFGSYAYGRPTKDSDIDLLVVAPSKKRPAERVKEANQVLADRNMPIDVVVLTSEEIKKRRKGFDPFLEEVFSRGRVLYETRR